MIFLQDADGAGRKCERRVRFDVRQSTTPSSPAASSLAETPQFQLGRSAVTKRCAPMAEKGEVGEKA